MEGRTKMGRNTKPGTKITYRRKGGLWEATIGPSGKLIGKIQLTAGRA